VAANKALLESGNPRGDLLWIAGLSLLTFLLHLLFHKGYGYFRDELYFIACGEHLDWGYVDQPPLVAVVAHVSRRLLGDTLFAIRFFSMLASALQVLFTGLTVRALGGRRYAQVLGCVAVLAAPIYFGSYLGTDDFVQLAWVACAYVAVVILQGGDSRLWLVFGAIAGFGLEGKHAMLFFGIAFTLGLLLTPQRRVFRDTWFWLGGLVALLIFLPNLAWEYRHHWATYELLANISHSNKNILLGPWKFFADQVLLLMPLNLPIWLAGLLWYLVAARGRQVRVLGWAYLIAFVLFVALKGKNYYLAPAYPPLLAAGAMAVESWIEAGRRAWLKPVIVVLLILGGAVLAPFAMPMMSPERFIAYERALHVTPPATETHRMGPLPQQYADMFGWPEMAATVAGVYDRLSPEDKAKCAIFGQNYGQAGAIDFFGRRYGLPKAISGHQNYYLWGPRGYTGECMIVLDDRPEKLAQLFNHFEKVATVYHPYSMPYEHFDVYLCRGLRWPLPEIWYRIKQWI
jgi:hypothetical protein